MRRIVTLLVGLAAACGARPEPRPNVLVITVDTLRADRLGCHGYTRPTSPSIDGLAAEGARFATASTPRAKTTPALASMLTGLYPHDHGVRDLATPLAHDVPLLQERLREHGYRTGAIVGNWVLADSRAGLARGFDLWCESFPDTTGVPPDLVPQRSARSLSDAALVALGLSAPPTDASFEPRSPLVRDGEPWFLWLHYMDPHGSYEPPVEHRRFAGERSDPVTLADAPGARQRVASYNVPREAWLDARTFDAEAVRALYDGEIAYVDREIGRVLDALRARGVLEDTLVVLTSDHGESLGEHEYYFEHGAYAYESTAHVPLIVRGRGIEPGVRTTPASLCDLAPTLLDLLGIPALPVQPTGPRGASLRGALEGREEPDRPLFGEKIERADLDGALQQKAVRLGRWKLIQSYASRTGSTGERETLVVREELYDLIDPRFGEEWDLSGSPPREAPLGVLRRQLGAFVEADRALPELGRLLEARRKGLEDRDPEAERTLRLLGY